MRGVTHLVLIEVVDENQKLAQRAGQGRIALELLQVLVGASEERHSPLNERSWRAGGTNGQSSTNSTENSRTERAEKSDRGRVLDV